VLDFHALFVVEMGNAIFAGCVQSVIKEHENEHRLQEYLPSTKSNVLARHDVRAGLVLGLSSSLR
jgi:hypothetical protein